MNAVQLVQSLLGTFPAEFQYIQYIIAGCLAVVVVSLVLSFFLGAISGLTNRFFK